MSRPMVGPGYGVHLEAAGAVEIGDHQRDEVQARFHGGIVPGGRPEGTAHHTRHARGTHASWSDGPIRGRLA